MIDDFLLTLRYKDSVLTNLEHAAQPEFFSFWLFLITPPLMYTFTVLYTFWKHRLPRFFVSQLSTILLATSLA